MTPVNTKAVKIITNPLPVISIIITKKVRHPQIANIPNRMDPNISNIPMLSPPNISSC